MPTVDELLEVKKERERMQRIEQRLAELAAPASHGAQLPRRTPEEEDGANCIAFAMTVRRLRELVDAADSGRLPHLLDGGKLRDALQCMHPSLRQLMRDGGIEWGLLELGMRLTIAGQARR